MKILIVRLSSIGDIVHALPALAHVRRELPDAEIGWAVDSRYAEILRSNRMIDHLLEIETRSLRRGKIIEEMLLDIGRQIGHLRKFKFDCALDMQGLLKSATLAKLSGTTRRFGFGRDSLREPTARFLYTDIVEIGPQTHVIKKNIALADAALGIETIDEIIEFPIFTDEAHIAEASEIRREIGGKFAILNPAGGWVTKLWPAENYGRLADLIWEALGLRSVVSVGPNDAELGFSAIRSSRSGKTIVAQPSLKGFYELAKSASIYVGGDTGPTHIAIAAGVPVVGIFGPTEWWRNGSLRSEDICIERNDIGCRVNCHRRTCSNWICMEISAETVLEAVVRRLAR